MTTLVASYKQCLSMPARDVYQLDHGALMTLLVDEPSGLSRIHLLWGRYVSIHRSWGRPNRTTAKMINDDKAGGVSLWIGSISGTRRDMLAEWRELRKDADAVLARHQITLPDLPA